MVEDSKEVSIIVHINECGEIVRVLNSETKEPLTDKDYDDEEKKRMDKDRTLLYTPNGCCWRKVRGRWRCHSNYCKS